MKPDEQVLVFPAELFDERHFKNSVMTGSDAIYQLDTILYSKKLHYTDRKAAEENPKLKQVIPYCVLTHGDNVFIYQRTKRGGDSRLHELYSLGVGGHINPEDGDFETEGYDAYFKAMRRELAEEVALNSEYVQKIVGVIYDSSNAVGQVHFGVVHKLIFDKEPVLESPDPALTNGKFCDKVWLKDNKDKFENWSKLIIENML